MCDYQQGRKGMREFLRGLAARWNTGMRTSGCYEPVSPRAFLNTDSNIGLVNFPVKVFC